MDGKDILKVNGTFIKTCVVDPYSIFKDPCPRFSFIKMNTGTGTEWSIEYVSGYRSTTLVIRIMLLPSVVPARPREAAGLSSLPF